MPTDGAEPSSPREERPDALSIEENSASDRRPACMKKGSPLVIATPLPPAADHITGALAWRKRALVEIESQRPAEHRVLAEYARVRILIGIVHGRGLVEIIAAAMEMLADAGVIAKLSVISDVEARWDKTIEPGRMRIEISQAVPPLRRIGAIARERIRRATAQRWAGQLTNSSTALRPCCRKELSGLADGERQ
jgi:hypothetical protein